jgi:hypothetical protein
MIEAETRKRTIELANDMTDAGLEVIAVYADAVFVRRTGPLPPLPKGWSVKHDLDGLRFLDAVSFASRQLTKLPGIPREIQQSYLQRRLPSQVQKSAQTGVPSDPESRVLVVNENPTHKGG